MNVTPKVYQFAPGAATGAAVVNGVSRCMAAAGVHHWEVVPGSYTEGETITLRDKATGNRRLRLVAQTNNVQAYYSANGGVLEAGPYLMSGGWPTYTLAETTYGINLSIAYIVETEDAITIAGGSKPSASIKASALGMGIHAGRIFSAHNRNDAERGVGEEAILCGPIDVYNVNVWSILSQDTTSGTNAVPQRGMLTGSSYIPVCYAASANGFRDKRTAAIEPLLADVGDSSSIERFIPIPITGPITGATSGHTSYTRYIRARKYGWGDTGPDGATISNATIIVNKLNPNFGWRHQYFYSGGAGTMINLVHVWCPPGQEIIVP